MKILRHTVSFSVLVLISILTIISTSHADLGLGSEDFQGKRVSGKPVTGEGVSGKPVNFNPDGSPNGSPDDDDGSSEGTPGTDDPMCLNENGNSILEGASCSTCPTDSKMQSCNPETCFEVQSHVNLFTRHYQDHATDMSVKVPGGHLKVFRLYDQGNWQHEHEYNRLDVSKSEKGIIKKANLTYTRTPDGIYRFKGFTIEQKENHFRWQNKAGDYVLYSTNGNMVETGNKIGVLARYIYANDTLRSINDRNNNPVYHFEYNKLGKITKARDEHERSVSYAWQNDNLIKVTNLLGHDTEFSYSPENQLISKTDTAGHNLSISYHPDGAVKSVLTDLGGGHFFSFKHIQGNDQYYAMAKSVMGNVQEYWYDRDGNTIKILENQKLVRENFWQDGKRISVDEIGSRTVKSYDNNDNLIEEEFIDGTSISHHYDSRNNRISTTNELGIEISYSYNNLDQIIKKWVAYKTEDEAITSFEYDSQGRLSSTTLHDSAGDATTTYHYDNNDNLIQITDPEGSIEKREYDYMGNIVKTINPVGLTTSMKYDSGGNLLSFTSQDGQKFTYTYDPAGRRLTSEDHDGNTKSYSYDSQDNLIQVKDALGGVIKASFDKDNRITKRLDQEGNYVIFFYEGGSKRISKIIDGSGNEIAIYYRGYDNCGSCTTTFSNKPIKIEFPTFTRQFSYDQRGRIIEKNEIIDNTILTEKFTYDDAGRLIASTDRSGETTTKEYDNLNRVTTITDPAGGKTHYSYTPHGRLMALTDSIGQSTTFEYDLNGNKTKETKPLNTTLNYLYDQAGRLLKQIDSEGQVISYFYNKKNGYLDGYLLKKSEDDFTGESVTFSYDSLGHLTGYDDGTTKATYSYDKLGHRLTTEIDYKTFTSSHSYTYYLNGKKKSYTGPDGLKHKYTYNPINLLEEIDIEGVGKIAYQNYKWLKPEIVTSPGIVREDTYDHFLRLTKRKTAAAGSNILDLSYEYNAIDNIISRTSENILTGYVYDDLQHLVQVDKGKETKTYSYDSIGNRLSTNNDSVYTYNANNQLLAVGETSYSYDNNGNTITKKTPNETLHFEYHFGSRLSKVTKDGLEATYYYDPFGRRISKEVNGERTYFAYSLEGLIAEYDASGDLTVTYSWKPDSMWSTDPIMTSRDNKQYFYHNDHLGAPNSLSDSNGKVVWKANYDVYGEVSVEKEEISNNLRLPGQYFDSETGLYYNWHRFYDPETGRYISADPIGLDGGINLYTYVAGNPINLTDPTGLCFWDLCAGETYVALLIASGIVYYGAPIAADVGTWLGEILWNEGSEGQNPPKDWPIWEPTEGETHPYKWDENEARYCPPDAECPQLAWSIDVLQRQLRFRRWDMQRRIGGGDANHKKHYNMLREVLRSLIARAKLKGCPYNPQADIEVGLGPKRPTDRY